MVKEDKTNIELHLLEPRATEKSYLEQTNRIYVFPVGLKDSKQKIASLVEKEFNVTVTDVRTMIRKGKRTKYSKGKHAYPGITYRKDRKFAYVKLKKGDSIKVFEDTDESEKDKTSAKEAKKKADKNAGKEKKSWHHGLINVQKK